MLQIKDIPDGAILWKGDTVIGIKGKSLPEFFDEYTCTKIHGNDFDYELDEQEFSQDALNFIAGAEIDWDKDFEEPEDDIWDTYADSSENETREIADPWGDSLELNYPESDLENIPSDDDWLEDPTPADWDDPNRFTEAVNKLEENENEVECKCCFELFPKESCIKTDKGYVCQKCNQELHSHQGTNLDLIDKDPFDLDYDDPRDPDEEPEEEIKEEPVDATEVRKHEKVIEEDALQERGFTGRGVCYDKNGKEIAWIYKYDKNTLTKEAEEKIAKDKNIAKIDLFFFGTKFDTITRDDLKEDLKVITDFNSYEPWSGAVDTYELIKDANRLDDLEAYLEELYPEGLTVTKINDILWFDGDQVLRDLGLGDVEEEDEVDESLTFEALDEYNSDVKSVYHYNCDPSGLEGDVEATSEKEARRKVEDTLAAAGIYVPDEIIDIQLANETLEEGIFDKGHIKDINKACSIFRIYTRTRGNEWPTKYDEVNDLNNAIKVAKDNSKREYTSTKIVAILTPSDKRDLLVYENGKELTNNLKKVATVLKNNKAADDTNASITRTQGDDAPVPEAPKEKSEEEKEEEEYIKNVKKELIAIERGNKKLDPVEFIDNPNKLNSWIKIAKTNPEKYGQVLKDLEALQTKPSDDVAVEEEPKLEPKEKPEEGEAKPAENKGQKLKRLGKENRQIADTLAAVGYNTDDLYTTDKNGKPKPTKKLNNLRKALFGEGLEEHINDRPADIESDQELHGTDNAVVDCEVAKVIAHSEDEKPLDCKMEKPALEEPLAGEEVDAKLYEDLKDDLDYILQFIKPELKDEFKKALEDARADWLSRNSNQNNDTLVGEFVDKWPTLFDNRDNYVVNPVEDGYGSDDIHDLHTAIVDYAMPKLDESLAENTNKNDGYTKHKENVKPDPEEKKSSKEEEDKPLREVKEPDFEDKLAAEYHKRLEKYAPEFDFNSAEELEAEMENDYDLYNEVIEYDDGDNFLDLYLNWWPDEEAFEAEDEYYNEPLRDVLAACLNESLKEDTKLRPWIMQQGEDGEPEFIGWATSQNDMIDKMVKDHRSDYIYENTYIDELDRDTYEYIKGDLSEDEIKELDNYFGITEDLVEAKKDNELPVDPEAAKLEVHTMLNDLVADEIEAINGYEEAKAEILDAPIAHKDNILDTVDHIEDEEKEHIDELIAATTEIPFEKEEAPAPVVEEPVVEEPLPEEEPFVEENLTEEKAKPAGDKEADYKAALKLAAAHNKPVIYGYSNKSYNGKYFTLDDPIVCDNVFDETKKFKQKYKSCGTTYVAYPDDYEGLRESYRFSPEEQEQYNCDEDGCYEDNGHWGRLVKCGWCEDFYDADECKFEVDFGWLCGRCQDELQNHGGPLMFIEPAPRSCDEEDELEANLHKNKE